MGAALEIQVGEPSAQAAATTPAPQTAAADGDANLAAKIQQIKAVVVPKIKDAVAADPSQKEQIVRLLATASKQEKQASIGDAFKTFKSLAETVKTALGNVADAVKYKLMLPGTEFKVGALKGHRQSQAIAADIGKIEACLAKAKQHAGKSEYADACKQLEKIDADYQKAKDAADTIASARETEEWLRTDFNNLKLHQGVDHIAGDLQAIDDDITSLDALIKGRKWNEFDTLVGDIADDIAYYKGVANKHGDYVGLRNNALMQVGVLEAHPNKDAIATEIAAIKKRIDDGHEEYETNTDYEAARDVLVQVEPEYVAARNKADQGGKAAFKKELDALKLKLQELEKPEKRNPILDGEIAAIKTRLATAEKYAAANQFPEAMKLLAAATKDIEAAEKLAAQQLALHGAQKAAGEGISNLEKDANAAVAAVQKLHDQLKTHPQVAAIAFELGEAQKSIDQAKTALA
jgi:hypothetical protein